MILTTLLATMAFQYIGTPYRWGGNAFDGLDCSGFVLKSMRDVGFIMPDMASQSIYNWTKGKNFQSCDPGEDCLLFFGTSNRKITHIAISLNKEYMIEAGGAGRESSLMSVADLARVDARVRIKPISNRRDLVESIKLKY